MRFFDFVRRAQSDVRYDVEILITLTADTGKRLTYLAEGRQNKVNWGDGTVDKTNIHEYAEYGNYVVKIKGLLDVTQGTGSYFREGKNSIVSVKINNPNAIGDQAFMQCSNLESVQFSGEETIIPYGSFKESGLISVTIPDSVYEIDQHAFAGCTRLTSVTLGSGCRVLDWNAFDGCTSLTNINLGAVKEIGENALSGCGFSNVDIHSVRTIGLYAFSGCHRLVGIDIPLGVKDIPELCFSGCESLYRVSLPLSIEWIGSRAFRLSSCDIYYAGTRAQWDEISKSDYWDNEWYGEVHCIDDL